MFFKLCLYSEDSDIDRKDLIELRIAEGLLKSIGGWQEQVNKGHTVLNKLENSCLLEQSFDNDERRCVKMHDMIRDMGIMITQSHPRFMAKAGLLLKELPEEEQWTEDLVKVSLRENEIAEIAMPKSPMCSKLSVLMLCRNPLKEIPETFFFHMRSLTVIDLSYTDIERLPESICGLENLRGLFLKCCKELIYVSSLSKLTKLTLLDLNGLDKIIEVPRGMENLKCLKKVNCSWNSDDQNYFNRMGEYRHFSELISYEFLLYRDPTVTEFYVPDLDEIQFEKRVFILGNKFGYGEVASSSTLLLPRTVEFLSIKGSIMKRKEYSLGDMLPLLSQSTELKLLEISDCDGMSYIFSNTDILDTLECLELYKLPDLKGLIQLGGETKTCLLSPFSQYGPTFSHLKKLTISGCNKIKVVFPLNFLQQPCLQNLEKISVSKCEEVEEIFESCGSNCPSSETTNNVDNIFILILPKLNRLKLKELPKLRNIYKGLICTPLLKSIDSDSLQKLGRIHMRASAMVDPFFILQRTPHTLSLHSLT